MQNKNAQEPLKVENKCEFHRAMQERTVNSRREEGQDLVIGKTSCRKSVSKSSSSGESLIFFLNI